MEQTQMSEGTYSSVSNLVASLASDALAADFKDRVSERKVVKALQAMRVAKNITQTQVAEALQSRQSRVSKIEHGDDASITLGEVEAYARALSCDVNIVFTKRDETAVDRVKRHAFAIKRELDRLAECAHADEKIASGVAAFFGDAFFNVVGMLADSSQKLPLRPDGDPYVRITSTLDDCNEEPDASEPTAPVKTKQIRKSARNAMA